MAEPAQQKPPYSQRRCGNCCFGKRMPQDLTKIMCHGEPPRLFMMGGGQSIKGGPVQIQFEAFRPIIAALEPACSHWEAAETNEAAVGASD